HLVRHKHRQLQIVSANRMLHLKTVSISRCLESGVAIPTLKLVSIAQPELTHIEPQRNRQHEPVLPNPPVLNGPHCDRQEVWRHRDVLPESKSETNTHALVYRMTDVTAEPECSEKIEINCFCDWNRELHVGPLLIVSSIDQLCWCVAHQHQAEHKAGVDESFQLEPFLDWGGRTVKEVSATTTRSPTCS